jgi:hypothetical protein
MFSNWNDTSKILTKKLWIPNQTDVHDFDSTFLKDFSKNSSPDLSIWSSPVKMEKTWSKTLWKFSPSLPQGITSKENVEKSTIFSTQKIRIYPDQDQKKLFRCTSLLL